LLLISGWGACDGAWKRTLAAMPEARPRLVAWQDCLRDGPGTIAAALAGASEPCTLIGWSLGGLLAIRAAIELPCAFSALVVVSGTARMCAAPNYPGADPRALRVMRARLGRDLPRVMQDFSASCFAPDGEVALREEYLAEATRCAASDLVAGLDCLATLDLRERLPQVRTPTLVVHGTDDQVIPTSCARYLADHLPVARLHLLERHGHALPLTAPVELGRVIESFTA
jgi:pimeloyl-[acyl-carrier protein] methyl ester esterase